MTQSRLLGVVPIAMFDSGQTLDYSSFGANYAQFTFEAQSTEPMLLSLAISSGALSNPTAFASEIMGVFGASSMTVNPTSLGLGGNSQDYIDGTVYYLSSIDSGATLGVFTRVQPRASGNWNNLPFSSVRIDSAALGLHQLFPSANSAPVFPMRWNGSDVAAILWANIPGTGPSFGIYIGTVQSTGVTNVAILSNQNAFFTASWLLSCRNPAQGAQYDNYILMGNPTLGSVQLVSFNSTNAADTISTQPVTIDSAVLNAVFQSLDSSHIKAYGKGFIAPLIVNGAGITKQYCEVCVFTPDMTGYYILLFQPQDTESALQLGRGNSSPQVKIDTDGIIWFNSGNITDVHKILYSYSSGYNFPVYYFGSLNPITLSCLIDSMPGVQYSNG